MTKPDPGPSSAGDARDDDALDAVLREHFGTAATDLKAMRQPSIASLLPVRRARGRWWAPAAVAGGLIAAATATVLTISSTAPSSGPTAGVAPSGGAAVQQPASQITVSGQEYELVGAVPWYDAMRIGRTVAVSTGPEIRGACDQQIYRLEATRSPEGELILTSYQYDPMDDQGTTDCAAIGLPPYVAALNLPMEPPSRVRDGARSSDRDLPLTSVLVPMTLPPGFEAGAEDQAFPQKPDPDRPAFPGHRSFLPGAIDQTYSSGTNSVTVTQGLGAFAQGYDTLGSTTVGPYSATINAFQGSPERCVRWTDPAAGKVEVCGTLNGGTDAVVTVARSIYPGSSTTPSSPSATPSADAEPAQRITIGGREFALAGAVPWYSAMRVGNTVAVTTGPKVRGACDTDLYRLVATTRNGRLTLTSYHYQPVSAPEATTCITIALAPFVAALELDSAPPATVEDGARADAPPVPITLLLRPTELPPGVVEGSGGRRHPQIQDPGRPTFPLYGALEDGTIVQSFSSGSAVLTVRQGVKRSTPTASGPGSTTVGPYPATLATSTNGVQHCVRWTDATAGGAEVCGNVPAATALAVARSIYP